MPKGGRQIEGCPFRRSVVFHLPPSPFFRITLRYNDLAGFGRIHSGRAEMTSSSPAAERVPAADRLTLAVLVLFGTFAAPLDAQGPVRQGERVRALTTDGAQFVGVVTRIDTESLRLRADGGTVPLNLALAEIQDLERSIGQGHHGRKWGTYGAIAGGGIGVLSGLTWWDRGKRGNQLATVAYLGVINAIWMGGVGYAAGYFLGKYDIWQTVRLGRSEQRGPGFPGNRSGERERGGFPPVLVGVSIPWG